MLSTSLFFRLELRQLLLRLAGLVREIGDRSLPPASACAGEVRLSAAALRPTYLRLFAQAARLAETLGFSPLEAEAYVGAQVLALLAQPPAAAQG